MLNWQKRRPIFLDSAFYFHQNTQRPKIHLICNLVVVLGILVVGEPSLKMKEEVAP
ncbi:hypothetical protein I8F73_05635 [Enterococcus faecalis]|nr:hypothetical protein [Enterococcus faecalis]